MLRASRWEAVAVALAATSLVAAPIGMGARAAEASAGRWTRQHIDPDKKEYNITVAYGFTTTLLFPAACQEAIIGDSDNFVVSHDKQSFPNRVVLTATSAAAKKVASSNLTVHCDQGIHLLFNLTSSLPSASTARSGEMIEFYFDEAAEARVKTAVEEEAARQTATCDGEKKIIGSQIGAAEALAREAQETKFLDDILQTFTVSRDEESARDNYVIVHTEQEVRIGGRGFIVFLVQNRSDNEVRVQSIEVIDEKTQQPLNDVKQSPENVVIPPKKTARLVAKFDMPPESDEFRLLLHDGGARAIEVHDIEFD